MKQLQTLRHLRTGSRMACNDIKCY